MSTSVERATSGPGGINHLEIVPYDGVIHGDFVYGTFAEYMRRSKKILWRAISRPGVVVLIASSPDVADVPPDPEEPRRPLLGWLAALPIENRIIFAYTKRRERGHLAALTVPPEELVAGREPEPFRVASSLAIVAGIRFDRVVPCSFWSRDARKIAAKPGHPYPLVYAPEGT